MRPFCRAFVPVVALLLGAPGSAPPLAVAAPPAAQTASPAAAALPPGSVVGDVAAALRAPFRPLNALTVDLDGDGAPEQAVLFGHVDAGGIARVEGLVLLSRAGGGRWRVEGAVDLTGSPFVSTSFAPEDAIADLDGDGAREVVVEERLAEADVRRESRTWWRWDRAGRRVTKLHEAEIRYRDGGVPGGRPPVAIRRTVTPLPPEAGVPRLAEDVERVDSGAGGGGDGASPAPGATAAATPTRHRIVYRLDTATGRFAAE